MTITWNGVFSQEQYLAIRDKAAEYFREKPKSQLLPLIKTTVPDAMKYRHRKFGDVQASFGTHEWSEEGTAARTKHGYEDFDLEATEMILKIPNSNITLFNSDNLLAEARAEHIRKWTEDVDNANFHGVIDETANVSLSDGLCDRGANTIENISSASDEDLSTKGEIYLGITNLIDEIPFRYRESGPTMLLFVTEDIDAEARRPDRIYQDKVEFDFIYENLIGQKASPARKIQWIPTNKILAEAYDDTAGNNADTADTKGTHSRMMLVLPDQRLVGRVVSRNFSLLGEKKQMLNTFQAWGWRGAACVFDENAVKYTEALTI